MNIVKKGVSSSSLRYLRPVKITVQEAELEKYFRDENLQTEFCGRSTYEVTCVMNKNDSLPEVEKTSIAIFDRPDAAGFSREN